eukprot:4779471-Amphidinium_carterae.1
MPPLRVIGRTKVLAVVVDESVNDSVSHGYRGEVRFPCLWSDSSRLWSCATCLVECDILGGMDALFDSVFNNDVPMPYCHLGGVFCVVRMLTAGVLTCDDSLDCGGMDGHLACVKLRAGCNGRARNRARGTIPEQLQGNVGLSTLAAGRGQYDEAECDLEAPHPNAKELRIMTINPDSLVMHHTTIMELTDTLAHPDVIVVPESKIPRDQVGRYTKMFKDQYDAQMLVATTLSLKLTERTKELEEWQC